MSLGGLILLSLALGVGAWLFFLWSVRSGQYDDPEGPKYRMLDEDEGTAAGEPPLDRGDGAGGAGGERRGGGEGPGTPG